MRTKEQILKTINNIANINLSSSTSNTVEESDIACAIVGCYNCPESECLRNLCPAVDELASRLQRLLK